MHAPVDGVSIGQHPLVTRLLKGVFQTVTCPPLPRYTQWYLGCEPSVKSLAERILGQGRYLVEAFVSENSNADEAFSFSGLS